MFYVLALKRKECLQISKILENKERKLIIIVNLHYLISRNHFNPLAEKTIFHSFLTAILWGKS